MTESRSRGSRLSRVERQHNMPERSEVLRVQNDALLSEYHNLIGAQIRRIDEAINVLDNERRNLVAEREHLLKHLPVEKPEEMAKITGPMPKVVQKGPVT